MVPHQHSKTILVVEQMVLHQHSKTTHQLNPIILPAKITTQDHQEETRQQPDVITPQKHMIPDQHDALLFLTLQKLTQVEGIQVQLVIIPHQGEIEALTLEQQTILGKY